MRKAIIEFMAHMLATETENDTLAGLDPSSGWQHPKLGWLYAVKCTDSARMLQQQFGGVVMGYFCKPADGRLGSLPCLGWPGGHDFLLVDNFLVDYWAAYVTLEIPVPLFSMLDPDDRAAILRWYGDPTRWEVTIHEGEE